MIKVIDWLNFWIGVVFAFAGVSFLISAIKHNTPFYFSNYLLFVIVGTLFFVGGIRLMIEARVEFDSTLHECTEWECTQGDFLIQDNQNGNWHCSFYDEGIYDTGLTVSHITGEKEPISKCVRFRERTECEKGNPEYVLDCNEGRLYDGRCFLGMIPPEAPQGGGSAMASPPVCRKKSVVEHETDYCDENPTDITRCYCSNETSQVGYYEQGVANYSAYNFTMDTKSWLDWNYGRLYFIPPPVNSFDVVDYSDCQSILGLTNISTSCAAWNITQLPVYHNICISAVPISEKLYCDENPTSDKCDCVEYEAVIQVNVSSAQTCQTVNINLNTVYACFTTDDITAYEGLELPELEIFGKTLKPELINDELLYYDESVCVGAVPKVAK